MVEFNHDNFYLAAKVLDRAADLCFAPYMADRMGGVMDLAAADGVNGNAALDLERLLNEFDDSNFLHDVAGIYSHINRDTGVLEDCFVPRCSKSAGVK